MPNLIKVFSLTVLVLLLVSSGCDKENANTIPNVHVDFIININDPVYTDLNAIGGWTYVTGGSRGIIIYRETADEFTALDRHCTYNSSSTCARVSVDSTNFFAVDDCCGSKFQLIDGQVVKGPAVRPLREYGTSFDGINLHVFNF